MRRCKIDGNTLIRARWTVWLMSTRLLSACVPTTLCASGPLTNVFVYVLFCFLFRFENKWIIVLIECLSLILIAVNSYNHVGAAYRSFTTTNNTGASTRVVSWWSHCCRRRRSMFSVINHPFKTLLLFTFVFITSYELCFDGSAISVSIDGVLFCDQVDNVALDTEQRVWLLQRHSTAQTGAHLVWTRAPVMQRSDVATSSRWHRVACGDDDTVSLHSSRLNELFIESCCHLWVLVRLYSLINNIFFSF